jgi:hypothetical protein
MDFRLQLKKWLIGITGLAVQTRKRHLRDPGELPPATLRFSNVEEFFCLCMYLFI